MFIEILFKMLLFKGGVLIYAEHYIYMGVWLSVMLELLLYSYLFVVLIL